MCSPNWKCQSSSNSGRRAPLGTKYTNRPADGTAIRIYTGRGILDDDDARRDLGYFACVNFFFLLFKWSQIISGFTGPIFTIFFHQKVDICVNVVDPELFFRFIMGRCHDNQFYGKIWVYAFIRQSGV